MPPTGGPVRSGPTLRRRAGWAGWPGRPRRRRAGVHARAGPVVPPAGTVGRPHRRDRCRRPRTDRPARVDGRRRRDVGRHAAVAVDVDDRGADDDRGHRGLDHDDGTVPATTTSTTTTTDDDIDDQHDDDDHHDLPADHRAGSDDDGARDGAAGLDGVGRHREQRQPVDVRRGGALQRRRGGHRRARPAHRAGPVRRRAPGAGPAHRELRSGEQRRSDPLDRRLPHHRCRVHGRRHRRPRRRADARRRGSGQ